ncbi:hypothetical protein COOONC_04698 [Cooperia oncophora]
MRYLLLFTAGVALADFVSQNSGYEAAEKLQPSPVPPVSASGGDQQAYNTDGNQNPEAPPQDRRPPSPPASVQSPLAQAPPSSLHIRPPLTAPSPPGFSGQGQPPFIGSNSSVQPQLPQSTFTAPAPPPYPPQPQPNRPASAEPTKVQSSPPSFPTPGAKPLTGESTVRSQYFTFCS